ncbi:XRE family transcriptional regulator [Kribbella sp. NPDC051587]|uniref:XRE family transcriptional regulator n=1 Tax=Kribbella sp. NPDC051587 TaxID=3364119 RepID=UPI0037A40FF7
MGERIVGRELAQVLRTGPFSAALHLAIEASGLRLEEIQARLAEQGIMVSQTTLAYWRRGRSRPERPASLLAVAALEGILRLPADALTAQLGPRRPRGRWLDHAPGTMELAEVWSDSESLESLLEAVNTPVHNILHRVSMHDLFVLGPDRGLVSLTTRAVVRATADKISRSVFAYHSDEDEGGLPTVHPVRNCRIGRTRSDPDERFLVAELIFDRVLGTGETAAIEYEMRFGPDAFSDHYHRAFPAETGDYLLQVQFDPAALPARCFRYSRRRENAPDQGVREVWVGSTYGVHVVDRDIAPGLVGLRWEWD